MSKDIIDNKVSLQTMLERDKEFREYYKKLLDDLVNESRMVRIALKVSLEMAWLGFDSRDKSRDQDDDDYNYEFCC